MSQAISRPAAWSAPPGGLRPADPARWPDVAAQPRGPRAAVARLLLARIAARLPVRVTLPSGEWFGCGRPARRSCGCTGRGISTAGSARPA